MCPSSQPPDSSSARKRVTEVARLFLRLGILAFGGPAAHIAMFHDETVKRRKWLDDQRFLDLLGITNLIPGPNSTEMAIHVGFERAGWPGLILGGACFIMPATIIVSTLAWAYVHFGSTAQAEWILYGVKPVVIAVIAQALWELGRKAVKNTLTAMAGMAVLVLYFIGMNEIALLFGGGLAVMLGENLRKLKGTNGFNSLIPVALVSLPCLSGKAEYSGKKSAIGKDSGCFFFKDLPWTGMRKLESVFLPLRFGWHGRMNRFACHMAKRRLG